MAESRRWLGERGTKGEKRKEQELRNVVRSGLNKKKRHKNLKQIKSLVEHIEKKK
ncbi:hypothetical protein RUM43_004701 [Polyplax serrata]|uniref:Uncharacterized protein n=1 Tax=Polyplax serrata TaxID=468196 RepID=A0AAN8SB55_POLSC